MRSKWGAKKVLGAGAICLTLAAGCAARPPQVPAGASAAVLQVRAAVQQAEAAAHQADAAATRAEAASRASRAGRAAESRQ